jgi:putative intracellular protease/amidase
MAKAAKVDIVEDEDEGSIIEFSDNIADAEAPEPLPEREYMATITKTVKAVSSNGNPYAAVTLRINEDDYPADFDTANAPGGKDIRHIVGLADDAPSRHRLRKFLEAIGAPMSKRIDLTTWIGLSGKISIKHDTYEGVKREKVSKVEPA